MQTKTKLTIGIILIVISIVLFYVYYSMSVEPTIEYGSCIQQPIRC